MTGATIAPARSAAATATASVMMKSPIGACGPCCSCEPNGTITGTPAFIFSSASTQVRSWSRTLLIVASCSLLAFGVHEVAEVQDVDRRFAGLDAVGDLALFRLGGLGGREHRLDVRRGHDDDAVVVREDPVAGMDDDVAARDRDLRLAHAPVRADARRDGARVHGKPKFADRSRVAHGPVDHGTGEADRLARLRHELPEERPLVIAVTGDDEHVSGLRLGESLVHGDDAAGITEDRERGTRCDGAGHAALDVRMHDAERALCVADPRRDELSESVRQRCHRRTVDCRRCTTSWSGGSSCLRAFRTPTWP